MTQYIEHPLIKDQTVQARVYQQMLFAESVKNNTLVILPTGLGKTVIMILLAAHFLKNTNKGIIIVAPTRPLVDQHYSSFRNTLDIQEDGVVIISGSTSPSKRAEMWSNAKVAIATPQTLRNDIVSGRCDINKYGIICFDEVHRAVGDDPYVLIAEQFSIKNPQSRIVGFTASPGTKEKLKGISQLLKINSIKYMDEDDPRVKPYIHGSDQEIIWLGMPEEMKKLVSIFKSYHKKNLKILKEIGVISSIQEKNISKKQIIAVSSKLNNIRNSIGDTEFFSGMKAYGQLMISTQGQEMLETQGFNVLKSYLESKRDELIRTDKKSLKRYLSAPETIEIMSLVEEIVSKGIKNPKINILQGIIQNAINENKNSRVLIFANYKATINFIVSEISDLPGIKAHKFVGQSSSTYGKGLKQKEQREVMDKFKSGVFNTLVSTSVGEEGLDVAQCDYVIFFDIPPSSTRLIQRSGRTGRARKGRVILLIMKGTRDEAFHYISKRRKDSLHHAIKEVIEEMENEQTSNHTSPTIDEYFDEDYSQQSKPVDENIEIKEEVPNFEKNVKVPRIYIDYREKGSTLLRELMKSEIELIQADLPIGDFILSDRVGVERKTVEDFCKSIIDNRLFTQLSELKRTFKRPLLILEGKNSENCRLSRPAFLGAVSSILLDYNIPVLKTNNQRETIEILYSIARREQVKREKKASITPKTSLSSIQEEQINILSSIPSINGILAEKLLIEFQSLRSIITAHPDALRKIHGIGTNIANRLDVLFSAPYDDLNLDD